LRFFKNNKNIKVNRTPLSTEQLVAGILPMFKRTTEEEIRRAAGLIDTGIDYAINGKISESESCFYELIKIHPELVSAWTDRALQRNPDGFDREFLGSALSERPINYENVLSAYPNSSRTLIWKGLALDEEGSPDQALECYRKAMEINKDSILILWVALRVERELHRDYEKAIPLLDAILRINPSDVLALTIMGGTLGDLGRPEEGLSFLDKALQIDPENPTTLCDKGTTMEKLRRPNDALDCFEKAINLQPNHYGALTNRGVILQALGRKEEAMKSYDLALEVNPNYSNALYNKARLRASLGQLDESLSLLAQAIAVDRTCKERAINAPELNELRNDKNFKRIVK
jgi:tetratricopeptide (TPR) repeat protein